MIGTYAAALAICFASLALGGAAVTICGVRRWSWTAPAVGLALLATISWATVRLPGHGSISAVVALALVALAAGYLQGRVRGWTDALRAGWPAALGAALACSLPFAVEGHFGILGTSFNPDMSQHLLAADRLAGGHTSALAHQGYPLGPHAIVVALDKGLDISLVHGFTGLTLAIAVLASLTALAAFAEAPAIPRTAASLVVGLAYLAASYYAQGSFKETMQALFVLAFALTLREAGIGWSELPLRFVPAALLAAGTVYTYSFPGLIWLAGTAVLWAALQVALNQSSTVGVTGATGPAGRARPVLIAFAMFLVLTLPEIGRMIDFHNFETFDPNGPGLGNLFGQISPLEALGIWPSGDFRLAPGDGSIPAPVYYLGAAFGLALLVYGLSWLWRRRETAIGAALATAALAYVAARVAGTPYTAAKAIEIGAPLVALAILAPLVAYRELGGRARRLAGAALAAFLLAAGACSVLALANAPVGPSSYSPALTVLRPIVAKGSTLVLSSPQLLDDEHGTPYIAWELRGGRVCIATRAEADGAPPPGVRYVVTRGSKRGAPFEGLRLRKSAPPYVLWTVLRPRPGRSPCPLVAVRQARQGPAR